MSTTSKGSSLKEEGSGVEPLCCFRCRKPLKNAAAYVTNHMFPVCDECLKLLCEDYWWDADSPDARRIRPEKLGGLSARTREEMEHELESLLLTIPLIVERTTKHDEGLLMKVASTLEIHKIPTLEN